MSRKILRRAPFRLLLLLALAISLALVGACRPLPQPPDFTVTLFSGETFNLREQAGKNAVAVNFWFPSCPPCIRELPDFENAWQELKDEDVRFVALFVPQGLDTEEEARQFVADLGLTFDFATDQGQATALAYQIQFFPTTVFINKKGEVYRAEVSTLNTEKIIRIFREMQES